MGTGRCRRHGILPASVLSTVLSVVVLSGCSTSQAIPQAEGTQPVGGMGGAPRTSSEPPPAGPSTTADPVPELEKLKVDRGRRSREVIAAGDRDAPYNYGPSVLLDQGRYRMWWCSQLGIANPPGDDILLAESRSMSGRFRGPDGTSATPVYSGSGRGFDAKHTCDPSVLKVGGTYYLYYTGAAGDHAHGNSIGLATSGNGREWSRANGGQPVVTPAHNVPRGNTYGAGQPSALFLDGWFYLMFTDTTGEAAGHNGAGQFVLRSRDPAFRGGVEALTEDGFSAALGKAGRQRSVVDAFSADWMWVDSLAAFAIAHQTAEGTTITFWDKEFRGHPYQPVVLRGKWREGPGLVRRVDGHAVASRGDPCGTVPIDLVRATREARHGPSDLRHFGLDLVDVGGCRSPERALLALSGFAMPSPQRTIDLIVSGILVRVERRSVAEQLAVRVFEERLPVVDSVTPAVTLAPGTPLVRAPDRGVALLLDNRLWRVSTDPELARELAELNSSTIMEFTAAQWDAYPRGPDLLPPPR